MTLDQPWKVDFMAPWGPKQKVPYTELSSWTADADPAVKYFSGTAAYRSKFTVTAERIGDGKRAFLDLGRVEVIAE